MHHRPKRDSAPFVPVRGIGFFLAGGRGEGDEREEGYWGEREDIGRCGGGVTS